MKTEKKSTDCCQNMVFKNHKHHHDSGAIYGIGIFGALFYFLQGATTFGAVLFGIFKSIFWPAFVLYKILTILQM